MLKTPKGAKDDLKTKLGSVEDLEDSSTKFSKTQKGKYLILIQSLLMLI